VLVLFALGSACLGAALALHPMTRPIPADPRALVRILVAVAALLLLTAALI